MKNHMIHKLPVQPIAINTKAKSNKTEKSNQHSFSQVLGQATAKQSSLTISKHAELRMSQRNISLEPHTWEEIGVKVNEAKKQGVKDSLVLLKNAALIISAKNNTVVTVMDRQEAGSHIFTNIDGTIVLD
ncbi:TIGR02530 family flagellar biosynthesis protein [Lederbergia panacisoli]|uniref:TIGR02530 family flagellar biosynthesis protein n=1 Tax=Lederbergia panacisoli TaxID=1255251 RepID=UPI00214C5EEC|nr:TIGR02530 family flagellar biosynthesis protein [Lederbergia panacisoli]MCR2820715.1 flagellar protein [Lederbergia panacisoli]